MGNESQVVHVKTRCQRCGIFDLLSVLRSELYKYKPGSVVVLPCVRCMHTSNFEAQNTSQEVVSIED